LKNELTTLRAEEKDRVNNIKSGITDSKRTVKILEDKLKEKDRQTHFEESISYFVNGFISNP
jgi:hypothetical protein